MRGGQQQANEFVYLTSGNPQGLDFFEKALIGTKDANNPKQIRTDYSAECAGESGQGDQITLGLNCIIHQRNPA